MDANRILQDVYQHSKIVRRNSCTTRNWIHDYRPPSILSWEFNFEEKRVHHSKPWFDPTNILSYFTGCLNSLNLLYFFIRFSIKYFHILDCLILTVVAEFIRSKAETQTSFQEPKYYNISIWNSGVPRRFRIEFQANVFVYWEKGQIKSKYNDNANSFNLEVEFKQIRYHL